MEETPPSHSLGHTTGILRPSTSHDPPQSLPLSHAPSQRMFPPSASAFVPPQGEAQALSLASPAPVVPEENLMHKNHLIQYCQKSGITIPVFQVVNEGPPHAPRFRCTVWVYGRSFCSPNTFRQRRAAEQDAAKLALEQLPREEKATSIDLHKLVSQDKTLCKMIVNEFAAKMNLGKCSYETVQVKNHSFPMFVSSLVLNGSHYKGEVARNKKEAEQLVAHAAVLSLLGDPTYAAPLSEVVMSKLNLYAAFLNVKDFQTQSSVINKDVKITTADSNTPTQLNQRVTAVEQSGSGVMVSDNKPETVNSEARSEEKDGSQVLADKQGGCGVQTYVGETSLTLASSCSHAPVTETLKPCLEAQPSLHEFKLPNSEQSTSQQIRLPIEFAPSATLLGPDSVLSSSRKRRRGRKNKASKRLQTENNDSTDAPQLPLNQPPQQCSVVQ